MAQQFDRTVTATSADTLDTLLSDVLAEMDARHALLADHEVTHVNDLPTDVRPEALLIATEADALLSGGAQVETAVKTLLLRGRAVGIYFHCSTSRADVAILSGNVKANLEARILLRAH